MVIIEKMPRLDEVTIHPLNRSTLPALIKMVKKWPLEQPGECLPRKTETGVDTSSIK
jgi:hypothetical protein